mgnify:CR=1 FL=1
MVLLGCPMTTTRLSSKGQVIIPKSVREARHWTVGTELVVVDQEDGVLLKSARRSRTRADDVIGCLKYKGRPVSDAALKGAIDTMFRTTWKP